VDAAGEQRSLPAASRLAWSTIGGSRLLAWGFPLLFAGVLLAAVAIRLALSLAYDPAVVTLADSIVYLDMAANDLFADPSRSVGYSLLLRGLHEIWADIDLLIAFQHLLGIATGLLLYASVRRLAAPRWAALAAAATVLLSVDQVFLEHALMPETAFTLALVGMLYAGVRALEEPRELRGPLTTRATWIAAAGALLGLSAWLRPVTAPLIPFLVLWLALALPGAGRARIANAAIGGAAAVAVLLGYFALHSAHTGYFGLSEATGWALYSRVAPFADCTRFEPPEGTEALCETTAEAERPGPDFYGWEAGSPARRLYGGQPAGNDELSAFARAAIANQPLSYAEDVARDFARYFVDVEAPAYSGAGYDLVEVDRRAPGFEEEIHAAINSYYADEPLAIRGGVEDLAAIQDVLRVRRAGLLAALVLALAGLALARGALRAGLVLLMGTALLSMLVPVATAIYSARYAIPVTGPLVAAAAIGFWLILNRARAVWAGRQAA
jgi:hypothetical protein